MLAMADRKGRVWASIPGFANRARISIEQAQDALRVFMSPDKFSRTKEFDGRRVEEIDGGWRLLNYEKYRAIRDEETIKESKRNYINKRRREENAKPVQPDLIPPKPPKSSPTLEEVKLACEKSGIPESDAVWFWNKCEGNGWTNGGKPIRSFAHTLAAWKAAGYLPSQKNGANGKPPGGNF